MGRNNVPFINRVIMVDSHIGPHLLEPQILARMGPFLLIGLESNEKSSMHTC